MEIPEDLLYTSEHEWVKLEDDIATVGITDYAQNELGDIVYVELPKVGDHTQQMEPFGTIEAVKAVSDLYAPLSGEVVEVNHLLEEQPELINTDPYGEGWMIKIKISDESEIEELLSPEEYQAQIE
ncbi:MAG: glycine cleavage system protein GcvH [Calditrichaeota bacterium]|nr:MAG: glycine cleavage system protein GcvH [Calditrichota bacterium]